MSSPRRHRPLAPWTALAAVFVLLVQGAFPSWAMARAMQGDALLVHMCTESGPRSVAVDDKGAPVQTSHDCCDLCVFAPALAAETPTALAQPVRYAVAPAPRALTADAPPPRARGPPRPPSQGPPRTV